MSQAMILSLPEMPSWELITVQLIHSDRLTPDIISTRLQAEANRRAQEKAGGQMAFQATGKRGRGRTQHGRGRGQGSSGGHGPQPDDECRYCKKKGHWANECRKKEADEKRDAPGGSANTAVSGSQDLGDREVGRVYLAAGPQNVAGIILDCGATGHMFCDKSYFVSYSASSGQTISVGDARNVPVEGLGSVRLRVRLPEGQRTVTLHKVMHAPKLSMNLVSLGALQREGAQYRSTETGLVVTLGKDELMHRQLKEGLYRVECIDGSTEAAFATSSGASMRTWHRRMGHLHLEGIRELARKGMVHGLTISSSDHNRVCEGCAIGKSHRLPLPKTSQPRYEGMDLIVPH